MSSVLSSLFFIIKIDMLLPLFNPSHRNQVPFRAYFYFFSHLLYHKLHFRCLILINCNISSIHLRCCISIFKRSILNSHTTLSFHVINQKLVILCLSLFIYMFGIAPFKINSVTCTSFCHPLIFRILFISFFSSQTIIIWISLTIFNAGFVFIIYHFFAHQAQANKCITFLINHFCLSHFIFFCAITISLIFVWTHNLIIFINSLL